MNLKQKICKRKLLRWILALIIISMVQMPVSVRAEESVEVATYDELISALDNSSANVIELTADITIPRDENGKDPVFAINRTVTITGKMLSLELGGIILGADVTLKDITINFINPVRNAIIANGYALTLENVNNGSQAFNIDIFCMQYFGFCGRYSADTI